MHRVPHLGKADDLQNQDGVNPFICKNQENERLCKSRKTDHQREYDQGGHVEELQVSDSQFVMVVLDFA